MQFRQAIFTATVFAIPALSASAQEACPTPELLLGTPVGITELIDQAGGGQIEKGEFETTAQFEARKAQIQLPSPVIVPLAQAPEVKDALRMVTLIEPKPPFLGEQDYHRSPTMDLPTDRHTKYKFLFADIKCVGALDGDGNLLAHWKTR